MINFCTVYFNTDVSKKTQEQPVFLGGRAREIAKELARGVTWDPATDLCSIQPADQPWRLGGIFGRGLENAFMALAYFLNLYLDLMHQHCLGNENVKALGSLCLEVRIRFKAVLHAAKTHP